MTTHKASLNAESWLASLVIRSGGTYGRGDRRRTSGTAVVEGFPRAYKVPHSHTPIGRSSPVCAGIPVRRRKYPASRVELFSLRKKRSAGIRLSAWQKAGSLYRLNPTPFSALKNNGNPRGIPSPWQEREGRALAAFPATHKFPGLSNQPQNGVGDLFQGEGAVRVPAGDDLPALRPGGIRRRSWISRFPSSPP